MADTLESLEIQVKHSASGADAEINNVANAVKNLSASLNGVPKKLKQLASAMNAVKGKKSLTIQTAETINNITTRATSAAKATTETSSAISGLAASTKKSLGPLSTFISSIKRIAFYRMIRSIIKSITSALSEGLKNAYEFSAGITSEGHRFAEALNGVSTSSLTMKNQLGSAFISLYAAVAPLINQLIGLVVKLADTLSQIFASFTGTTYLKAVDVFKEWGDTAEAGAKATKEWKNQLLGFDEINRLEAPSDTGRSGTGTTGPSASDMFVDAPLSDWALKMRDILSELAFNIKDVLFKWDNLTPEDVAQKAISGLSMLLGAGVGFTIAGVPGAIVGTLVGLTFSLIANSMIFDHDGELSGDEIADMISLALTSLAGGVIGFVAGGPGGALIGITAGAGLWAALKAIDIKAFGEQGNLVDQLATAMTTLSGAAIGFVAGGPAGALIGATIGLGISAIVESLKFSMLDNEEKSKYRSGLDWFVCGVLGLPTDEEIKQWGKNALLWLAEGFLDLSGVLHEIIGGPLEELIEVEIPETLEWFEGLGSKAIGWIAEGFKDLGTELDLIIFQPFRDLWDSLSEWWTGLGLESFHVSLPHIFVDWNQAGGLAKFFGFDTVPSLRVEWFANGGFPDEGSLYFAGERGPELVGTMGNRNAVANNDQIVAAIEGGVFRAVSSAMSVSNGGGGSRTTIIEINGREFFRATYNDQKAVAKERGISLIANG